jgi:hypothetical protein
MVDKVVRTGCATLLAAVVALSQIRWISGAPAGATTTSAEARDTPAELSRKVTSAPRALNATPRPKQVVLSWSAPSTGYRVQRRAAGAKAWTTVDGTARCWGPTRWNSSATGP